MERQRVDSLRGTVRECLHCGGSALVDYAYGCEHVFDDVPEPTDVREVACSHRGHRLMCDLSHLAPLQYGVQWPPPADWPAAETCWIASGPGVKGVASGATHAGAIDAWRRCYPEILAVERGRE